MKKKKRKNLTFNITRIYSIFAILFLVGAVFFGSSKLLFAEKLPINQTPLNEELDLRSNGKMTINNWIYDKDKGKMEIVLVTNGIKDYKSELTFSSVTRENASDELPLEVVYEDNEIYVIEISEIEENFKQIALRLHKNEKDISESFDKDFIKEDKESELFSTIYTDEREVERKSINEKETSDYVLEITDGLIDETTNEINNEEDEIEVFNKENVEINKEIEELEDDLLYQTVDEQVDTSNKIERLKKEIENNNKEIEEHEINIGNLESKIEKLENRKKDIEYNL